VAVRNITLNRLLKGIIGGGVETKILKNNEITTYLKHFSSFSRGDDFRIKIYTRGDLNSTSNMYDTDGNYGIKDTDGLIDLLHFFRSMSSISANYCFFIRGFVYFIVFKGNGFFILKLSYLAGKKDPKRIFNIKPIEKVMKQKLFNLIRSINNFSNRYKELQDIPWGQIF